MLLFFILLLSVSHIAHLFDHNPPSPGVDTGDPDERGEEGLLWVFCVAQPLKQGTGEVVTERPKRLMVYYIENYHS